MNTPRENLPVAHAVYEMGEAETTLRIVANIPAPNGIEDRIHAALRQAPRTPTVLNWPSALEPRRRWMQSSFARTAAAAAIVFVVAGGGWGVYSRVQPVPKVIAMPRVAPPNGFSTAGAMRTPQTLSGPTLPHATAEPKSANKAPENEQKKTERKSPASQLRKAMQ